MIFCCLLGHCQVLVRSHTLIYTLYATLFSLLFCYVWYQSTIWPTWWRKRQPIRAPAAPFDVRSLFEFSSILRVSKSKLITRNHTTETALARVCSATRLHPCRPHCRLVPYFTHLTKIIYWGSSISSGTIIKVSPGVCKKPLQEKNGLSITGLGGPLERRVIGYFFPCSPPRSSVYPPMYTSPTATFLLQNILAVYAWIKKHVKG